MNHWAHLIGGVQPPATAPIVRPKRRPPTKRTRVLVPVTGRVSRRRQQLLEHLRTHGHATSLELAEVARHSKNTIFADMAALMSAGHPVKSTCGRQGGYAWVGDAMREDGNG